MGWAARARYQTITKERALELKDLARNAKRVGIALERRKGKWVRPRL